VQRIRSPDRYHEQEVSMKRQVCIQVVLAAAALLDLSASSASMNQQFAGSESLEQSPLPVSAAPADRGQAQASAWANLTVENRIAVLKKHAIAVRSIGAADVDFTDLEPLRSVIGNRRIVMLGETSHGDGAGFAAKTRLIKFLHERMGFDVLALEGGLYDVRKVWSTLRAGRDPIRTVRSGVFREWADSRQVEPLWRYLVEQMQSTRPLELAGFDLQFTGSASREHLVDDLHDYLRKVGVTPEAVFRAFQVSGPLNRLMRDWRSFQAIDPEERSAILAAMAELGRALEQGVPGSPQDQAERDFWIQLLKSSATMMEFGWKVDLDAALHTRVDSGFVGIVNMRDRQMADNLMWLAKQAYPTRKIIVWAATSHLIRNRGSAVVEKDPMIPMGDWIDQSMGSEVYTLGFTAYTGRWGTLAMAQPTDLKAADENSLESLLFKAGFEFAWVDFRSLAADAYWLREPVSSRTIGYEPRTADWTRVMDGIFFIRDMFPSTPVTGK
jgi:erythromycin esterase